MAALFLEESNGSGFGFGCLILWAVSLAGYEHKVIQFVFV